MDDVPNDAVRQAHAKLYGRLAEKSPVEGTLCRRCRKHPVFILKNQLVELKMKDSSDTFQLDVAVCSDLSCGQVTVHRASGMVRGAAWSYWDVPVTVDPVAAYDQPRQTRSSAA